MNHIPIKKAMILWNPRRGYIRPGTTAGEVAVCEHPDTNYRYIHLINAVVLHGDMPKNARISDYKLQLLIEAWHMIGRDGMKFIEVHNALMDIPEYRDMLSSDFTIHQQES